MQNAQQEEFKHFAMDLEFLLRRTPKWEAAMEKVLFSEATSSSSARRPRRRPTRPPRTDQRRRREGAVWPCRSSRHRRAAARELPWLP